LTRILKIGITGTRGIPNAYGGFEQFAGQLASRLSAKGHDVFVYNSSLHPYQQSEWQGVKIIHRKDWENRIGTAGQFIYDLNCLNDAQHRNFDILLHLGYTSDAIWFRRWPKKAVNIVNMDGLEWKRAKYNKPVQQFLKWSESIAATHADIMIADSSAIADYLVKTYSRNPVYIPYGAAIIAQPDPGTLNNYGINPGQYFLLISRMEPENNIEMIIRGHLASGHDYPLLIIGNTNNSFGKYITGRYNDVKLKYLQAIYDQSLLNTLRYYAALYFHGHSSGGTNPSLLEAMACGSRIVAHDNPFNRAVLGSDADYFITEANVRDIILGTPSEPEIEIRKQHNLEKILSVYNHDLIADAYENLMFKAYSDFWTQRTQRSAKFAK
jgi:glycosyltransferase involved in cell wall biosynthesis